MLENDGEKGMSIQKQPAAFTISERSITHCVSLLCSACSSETHTAFPQRTQESRDGEVMKCLLYEK